MNDINVTGEISNYSVSKSGHIYFTLKDSNTQIPCVMFKGKINKGLSFDPANGDKVTVKGSVDVYKEGGRYQLYADKIERSGVGELFRKFGELKVKLEEMGMFDRSHKKPLPRYVSTLGVVTAPGGAAVRDIIKTVRRHAPGVQIILYPTLVQGKDAAEGIAQGIQALQYTEAQVIIVGRGGGSIEDLWAFNEMPVIQAVFNSEIPIISGVGHETDTTLCDLVADCIASTPTAAAEIAVSGTEQLDKSIREMNAKLDSLMKACVREYGIRLKEDMSRLDLPWERTLQRYKDHVRDDRPRMLLSWEKLVSVYKNRTGNDLTRIGMPWQMNLRRYRERVNKDNLRLSNQSPERKVRDYENRLAHLYDRAEALINARIEKEKGRCRMDHASLKALSPAERLSQGYSFTEDENGVPLKSVGDVKKGMAVRTYLKGGHITSEVMEVTEDE
ncbi:MAG: exodeoxyribonuclease VII large subunit [Lachnospiraceae bacterium]|nr:exodeoxyribonuclease VII large subunit [Lachnospiraceae bacterium]